VSRVALPWLWASLSLHAGLLGFLGDPKGVVRFASAQDLSAGRNVDEVLRVLDALQTGGLTACNWKRGAATLSAR